MKANTSQPLISVIVPIYKTEQWLSVCIDSLLAQHYQSVEIILVNDGSPDKCDEICNDYVRRHRNIIHIYQNNSGVSAARNTGIAAAHGKYLAFVDSDDWVDKDYLAVLAARMEGTCADMACVGYTIEKEGVPSASIIPPQKFIDLKSNAAEMQLLDLFKTQLLFSPCVFLLKKEIIEANRLQFPHDISFGEDRIFNLNYLAHCKSIACSSSSMYHYRIGNPDSLSHLERKFELKTAKMLFYANNIFFQRMHFGSLEAKQWLYTPVFDAYSNHILMLASINPEHSFISLYRQISSLLSEPLCQESTKWANLSLYPKHIVFLIKHRIALALSFISIKIKH